MINKSFMKNWVKNFSGSNLLKIGALIIVGGIVIFLVKAGSVEPERVHVVGLQTVEKVVLLSGSVRAVGQVDLSFEAAGKVATTSVMQGDVVVAGQVLARLDYKILEADLLQAQGKVQSAQSGVALARASVKKAEANLALVQAQNRGTDSSITAAENVVANTINEQKVLVKNAHLDLLNNDLVAYPVDNYRNFPSPVVSGNYTEEKVGEYILDFYRSGGSTGYSARVSGLSGETVAFDDFGIAAPLGRSGLYLTLPATGRGESYGNTNWIIPVPNTRSASYQTKLGAYNKALQTQSTAVSSAESNLDTINAKQASGSNIAITTAQEEQAKAALQEVRANLDQVLGTLAQAQAGVDRVQAQIDNNIITAPFAGTIARFDFKVGQSVGPGQAGGTIVTAGDYELRMSVPEIDVAKVTVGDTAEIILDAYGTEVIWSGVLSEIESIETKVDGVPSYSSIVTITNPDKRIKIGMNARAKIVITKKDDVVAVPISYVTTKNSVSTVLVKVSDRLTEERTVKTGLVGTDYFVEVISGLVKGETLIAPVGK